MPRHLFDVSRYGIDYKGEIVKETDKTYTTRHYYSSGEGRHSDTRRAKIHGLVVVETDDPEGYVKRARAEWSIHSADVTQLEEKLTAARRVRHAAVLEVLK